MIDVIVLFEDGNTIRTSINGTLDDAKNYYLGKRFNFGDNEECPKDKMVLAISVKELISKHQVHFSGTEVVIDNDKNEIGILYVGETKPREVYSLDDDWIKKYRFCRYCNNEVSDDRLARAYFRHEPPICSPECLAKERLSRYACCDKAVQRGCVCNFSTECPEHGRQCNGTHD